MKNIILLLIFSFFIEAETLNNKADAKAASSLCREGDVYACYDLVENYTAVKQWISYEKSDLYNLSCMHGMGRGCFDYANYLDEEEADSELKFAQSCSYGFVPACKRIFFKGDNYFNKNTNNLDKAILFFKKACNDNNQKACLYQKSFVDIQKYGIIF